MFHAQLQSLYKLQQTMEDHSLVERRVDDRKRQRINTTNVKSYLEIIREMKPLLKLIAQSRVASITSTSNNGSSVSAASSSV